VSFYFLLNTVGGISMRLQNLDINPSTMKLEIDIMEQKGSFAIVVCDGKARITTLPDHGETKIITHQGKVKRVKFDEGEDF
jgi:NAD kinase